MLVKARPEVVTPPAIEGAVDIPKLCIRVCVDNKLKRGKTMRKKSGPCPLNSSPQVNITNGSLKTWKRLEYAMDKVLIKGRAVINLSKTAKKLYAPQADY